MTPGEIKRMLVRSSPAGLAAVASRGRWKMAPHLDLLNRKLVQFARDVIERRSPRLMISMPPRHGKSELTSKHFPPWFQGHWPDCSTILCSYADDFASEWGLKSLQLFEEFGPSYFGVSANPRSRAANLWEIDGRAGGMRTAGVGSGITGRGGDVLIIDDSIKDFEQANSEVYRRKAKDWWGSTFYTRLAPGGGILLMQTRWHEDDLPGYVLKLSKETGHDRWDVLNLPALAGPDDPLGRREGEPLWPARFDADALARIRSNMSEYWWSALYQGSPQPAAGGAFKRSWLRYWRTESDGLIRLGKSAGPRFVALRNCRRFLTVDLAFSLRREADFTVIAAWAVTPQQDLVLLDIHRERLEGPDIVPQIKRMAVRHDAAYVGIEDVAAQAVVVQQARKASLTVRALKADRDKLSRAIPATVRMEAEQVFLPESHPELGNIETELLAFPHGAHDDIVDNLAYAAIDVQRLGRPAMTDTEEKLLEYSEQEQAAEFFSRVENPLFWVGDDDD